MTSIDAGPAPTPGQAPKPDDGKTSIRAVKIYSRYERFWHWSQAILIFVLIFSGFNLHGTYSAMHFGTAVKVHSYAAVLLILLWVFTTFWHFTTGQWRHYLPRRAGLLAIIKFYAFGILMGAPHPYSKTLKRKQNALQSLSYLTFMVLIGPALWSTGIVYLFYGAWEGYSQSGTILDVVVFLHTAAAFLMVIFIAIHVYMTTTGKTLTHYVKTMITGYEKVELSEIEEAYLEAEEPDRLQ